MTFYIFDWDGTLSDSAGKIVSCMQLAITETGMPALDDEEIRNIIGLGLPEAIRTLYRTTTDAEINTLAQSYSRHFLSQDAVPSSFFPEVLDTLEKLKGQSLLAVATGKSRRGLDRVLNNLNMAEYFHFSRCADETASKPDPLMLRELLDEAGVSAREAVMVGDTEWDMRMADNIGMRKIAVSYGAHHRDRLAALAPDMLIDDFSDVLAFRF